MLRPWLVRLLAALSLVAGLGLAIADNVAFYARAQATTQMTVDSLADVLAEHCAAVFQSVEHALSHSAEAYLRARGGFATASGGQRETLATLVKATPAIDGLAWIEADGSFVATDTGATQNPLEPVGRAAREAGRSLAQPAGPPLNMPGPAPATGWPAASAGTDKGLESPGSPVRGSPIRRLRCQT
ncbi:MAG: hypothetical protein EXQ85_09355 [Alphaproteobacteria bacterium]|nr:hypothetical protein [Alphaproteobacteria bacterium]